MMELLHDYDARCALGLFVLNFIMFICVTKSWFWGAHAKTTRLFLCLVLLVFMAVSAHALLSRPL